MYKVLYHCLKAPIQLHYCKGCYFCHVYHAQTTIFWVFKQIFFLYLLKDPKVPLFSVLLLFNVTWNHSSANLFLTVTPCLLINDLRQQEQLVLSANQPSSISSLGVLGWGWGSLCYVHLQPKWYTENVAFWKTCKRGTEAHPPPFHYNRSLSISDARCCKNGILGWFCYC